MTLNGKILRGLSEHEKLKPPIIRNTQKNGSNLPYLKQALNIGIRVDT